LYNNDNGTKRVVNEVRNGINKGAVMKRISCMAILIAALSLSFFVSESVALMVGMTTEELTNESALIFEGVVEDTKSQWSKDGKTIITRVTVSYTELIKGKTKDRKVVVEYDGGVVGDTVLRVSDMADFQVGERVILFLSPGKSKKDGDVYSMVGKSQGKYTIDGEGIARKKGFSFVPGTGFIDNNLPADKLKEKIKKVKSK
jgi:hypothetical protein